MGAGGLTVARLDQLKAGTEGVQGIKINNFPVIQTMPWRLVQNAAASVFDRGGSAFYIVNLE